MSRACYGGFGPNLILGLAWRIKHQVVSYTTEDVASARLSNLVFRHVKAAEDNIRDLTK